MAVVYRDYYTFNRLVSQGCDRRAIERELDNRFIQMTCLCGDRTLNLDKKSMSAKNGSCTRPLRMLK